MRRFYDRDRGQTGSALTLRTPATIRPRSIATAIVRRRPRGMRRVNSKGIAMSRRCELTGKGALVGHKVSHSNIKTKRRFLPNLLNVTMISDALGRSVRLRVSANALKTVDHRGGLDAFLMKAKDDELSPKARELKRADRQEAGQGRLTNPYAPPSWPGLSRPSRILGARPGLFPDQRELQQQRALQRREIVVGDQRQHQSRRTSRCTDRPSILSI